MFVIQPTFVRYTAHFCYNAPHTWSTGFVSRSYYPSCASHSFSFVRHREYLFFLCHTVLFFWLILNSSNFTGQTTLFLNLYNTPQLCTLHSPRFVAIISTPQFSTLHTRRFIAKSYTAGFLRYIDHVLELHHSPQFLLKQPSFWNCIIHPSFLRYTGNVLQLYHIPRFSMLHSPRFGTTSWRTALYDIFNYIAT